MALSANNSVKSEESFFVLIITYLTIHFASYGNKKNLTKKDTKIKEFLYTFSITKCLKF